MFRRGRSMKAYMWMVRLVQPLQRLRLSRLNTHLSLNARLIQHRGGRRTPPSPNVSCAFRPWPLLAGAHTLAHPRIPEDALITNRAPPTSLAPDYKCIRFPIRTAPASFIVCEPVPFAQVPCVQALVYPAPHCCPTICFPESQLNVVRFR